MADMVLFAGNTVWSISERVRGVCVYMLYKSTLDVWWIDHLQWPLFLFVTGAIQLLYAAAAADDDDDDDDDDTCGTLSNDAFHQSLPRQFLNPFSQLRLLALQSVNVCLQCIHCLIMFPVNTSSPPAAATDKDDPMSSSRSTALCIVLITL